MVGSTCRMIHLMQLGSPARDRHACKEVEESWYVYITVYFNYFVADQHSEYAKFTRILKLW